MEAMETRIFQGEDFEMRMENDSRIVYGNAIVFNKDSSLLYEEKQLFYERIAPQAMDGIIAKSDIKVWLNHDKSRGLLARSKNGQGSLSISIDQNAVKYSFVAPNFPLGDELVEGIRRKDIIGTSFAFRIAEGGEKWMKRADGSKLRVITKFESIGDISPCYDPAYEDTTVALRNLQSLKDEEIEPEVIETKPIIEEPIIEPIVERIDPVIEPVLEQRNINLNNKIMPTIKELQDQKATALEENDKIFNLRTAEKRAMTETEESTVNANNQRIKEFDLQLETETRKLGSTRFQGVYIQTTKKEEFSLLRAIREVVNNKPLHIAAQEMNELGVSQFRASGSVHQGNLVIPYIDAPWKYEKRADIKAQTATAGMEIVAEDKKAILPPLVDRLVFSQAGVTYLTGLVGDVSIPSYAGTTVAWKDEIEGAADGGAGFTEVSFAPKRLTGYVNVSKTFLAQDGVGAESLLMSNIADAVARKLEATILGIATSSSKAPSGIGYKLNVANGGGIAVLTTTGVTYAAMVGLETAVDVANAGVGNLAYITNSTARGLLKIKDIGTSNDTGDFIMAKDNTMNGYPVLVTNAIPSTYGAGGDGNAVIFGNWKDLCIGQWGGYDITIDPYTAAKTNQIVLVINAYFDAKGLRGKTGSSTTLDEYAYSFAALSIK
jgi:HK97 family phage major capsid protein/HK97 family phage prohead protease